MSWIPRFLRSNTRKAKVAASYTCSSTLKTTMMSKYPDLKAAELEALTWLTGHNIGEASEAIGGFMGQTLLLSFIEKVRTVDPAAAEYLDRARSAE